MARWKRSTDIAVSPVGADATADMTMDEQPRRANRLLDLALGVAGLLVAVPVAIGAALAMRASGDRGPLLYRAQRVGEHGREVTVFKLRSMRVGAAGLPITSSDDDRITPVGRFLRRYKLDELPQFFNVVRGDMSVVGPRPEDRSYVDWTDPLHRFVFSARPGIMGRASPPSATKSGCWSSRIRIGTIGPRSSLRSWRWTRSTFADGRSEAIWAW